MSGRHRGRRFSYHPHPGRPPARTPGERRRRAVLVLISLMVVSILCGLILLAAVGAASIMSSTGLIIGRMAASP